MVVSTFGGRSRGLRPTNWLIRDKVPAAAHLGQVLHATDKRDEIERRINRASDQSLATNGLAERDDREHAAYPRHRTVEPPRDSATGISAQLFSNTHAMSKSNLCSVSCLLSSQDLATMITTTYSHEHTEDPQD